MRDTLTQALSKSTADYAEVRYEHEDATSITCRGEEVEDVSARRLRGGIVRACTKGGWGLATFDSLDELGRSVAEACECAALVGREKTELADAPVADGVVAAELQRDFRGVSFDDKLALVKAYNDIVLTADPAIETSRAGYVDQFRTVHFASSRGAYFREDRPRVMAYFVAVARDGALVQQAHDGSSSAVSYDAVVGLEEQVEAVARRAAAQLKAPQCPGGRSAVILDPELGGVFAHEAFGHLSEADHLYENPKMRELMHLGRKMGVEQLQIVDDGAMGSLLGTHAFDDEGTPTGKTHLIRDGVLVGHLHSLETAAKMGARPTGNARTVNRTHPPIVRMTNTYIGAGELSFDGLIGGVDEGVYACGCIGGQTMMEMFTFSASHGYRIRNGQVGELVRDVVLTGNVFETLHAMNGFGSDLRMIQKGPGGCGKGGQSPLPVTFGSPHLRIDNVVVGGA